MVLKAVIVLSGYKICKYTRYRHVSFLEVGNSTIFALQLFEGFFLNQNQHDNYRGIQFCKIAVSSYSLLNMADVLSYRQ